MREWFFVSILFFAQPVLAIEPQPTEQAIAQALADGTAAAEQPAQIKNRFGDAGFCGWGFVQTKLVDFFYAAHDSARVFKTMDPAERPRILGQTEFLVWYVLCTNEPNPGEIHIVLKQGDRVIQAQRIGQLRVDTTPSWPNSPAYSATIPAYFSYASVEPKQAATIVIIPPAGPRLEYQVEFSAMP